MSDFIPGELLVMFDGVETLQEAKAHLEALGLELRQDVAFASIGTVLAGVPEGKEELIADALSKIVSGTVNSRLFGDK